MLDGVFSLFFRPGEGSPHIITLALFPSSFYPHFHFHHRLLLLFGATKVALLQKTAATRGGNLGLETLEAKSWSSFTPHHAYLRLHHHSEHLTFFFFLFFCMVAVVLFLLVMEYHSGDWGGGRL